MTVVISMFDYSSKCGNHLSYVMEFIPLYMARYSLQWDRKYG
jgi:hypothetical protein